MNATEETAPETSRSLRGAEGRDAAANVTVESVPSQPLSRGRLLFAHMNTVVRCLTAKQMPVEPRMVLTVMVDHANSEGVAWPMVETVATQAGVSERTARNAIRDLERLGWLTALSGQKGGRISTRYRVNLTGRPFDSEPRGAPRAPQGGAICPPGGQETPPRGAGRARQGGTACPPGGQGVPARAAPRAPDPHSDPLTDPHNEAPIYPHTPEATPAVAPAAPPPQAFALTPPEPPKAKRKTPAPRADHPMPADWQTTPAHAALAKREGVHLEAQEERFRYWAEGKLSTSWNGRFSTWLLTAGADRRARGEPAYEPPPPKPRIPAYIPPTPLRRSTFEEQRAKQTAALEKLRLEEESRMAERAAQETEP